MQDIHEESLNESVKSEQSPRVVLWEIDLTVQGGERYFFCNELNEKGGGGYLAGAAISGIPD
ncbi:hypothetical protein M10153_0928 [Escherichia coli]|nr:hypothetical protein M10153_0928 [Escherichia coli]